MNRWTSPPGATVADVAGRMAVEEEVALPMHVMEVVGEMAAAGGMEVVPGVMAVEVLLGIGNFRATPLSINHSPRLKAGFLLLEQSGEHSRQLLLSNPRDTCIALFLMRELFAALPANASHAFRSLLSE